jgi:hypothetical protein
MQHSIKVGVFNWTSFMKGGGFYPDDMPVEWNLTYFSNEFTSACLSLSALDGKQDLLLQWAQDLDDSFDLSLFIDHENQIQTLKSFRLESDLLLKYLVVDEGLYAEIIKDEVNASTRSALGMRQADQVFASTKLWTPVTSNNRSSIALMPQTENIRRLRGWVEQWVEQQESMAECESDLTLWLDGLSNSYQMLKQCRTLVELMGY